MDIVIRHPEKPQFVTVGILTDFARFPKAADPIEWDVFKTTVFQDLTKWDMVRTWSPIFFRRLQHTHTNLIDRHQGALDDYVRRKQR